MILDHEPGERDPNSPFEGVVTAEPALGPLTDRFALPAWLPLANVFSVGDVLASSFSMYSGQLEMVSVGPSFFGSMPAAAAANASLAMVFSFFVAMTITPWLLLKIAGKRFEEEGGSGQDWGWKAEWHGGRDVATNRPACKDRDGRGVARVSEHA